MPESASSHEKLTVTGLLFHPLVLADGVLLPVIVGAVLSILIFLTVIEAVFPALSVAVPVADWPSPSNGSDTGPEHESTSESESMQEKLTNTSELCHPAAFAAGLTVALIVGEVLSIFT